MYLAPQLRKAVEARKNHLIKQLIQLGLYKKSERHLYELPLSELEREYKFLKKTDSSS
ncbi:Fur-regulated basic protein FbpA [Bacillus sp. WMMC1349]|uniref:Fur-regulated basic protein FbpA n=1 Tax=Bacillus sp. WMMC1349 TaxID=2736254 RepID=UPI001557875A|nr:Fur-regulated basic protein FbpA [Bacillus sp. WMMC1349]